MSSPLPAQAMLPVIAIAAIITVLRLRLIRDSPVDRLINRSMIWLVVDLLLHLRGLAPEYASLMHQSSLGASLAILSGTYGLSRLWSGAAPLEARTRQRRYDLVATVSFALMFLAGTPARQAGLLIDQALGWPAIVFWAVYGAAPAVAAGRIAYLCVRESRTEELSAREKMGYSIIFAGAAAIFLDLLTQPLVAALCTYTEFSTHDESMTRKAATLFVIASAASLVSAAPLLKMLTVRLRWDRDGRRARRLLPLWRDLTAVLPHLSLYTADELAGQPAAHRVHRMSIEIQDALLRLRAYMPPAPPASPTDFHRLIARYAQAVALAAATVENGAPPDAAAISAAPRLPEGPSEIETLLALARHWPGIARSPTDGDWMTRSRRGAPTAPSGNSGPATAPSAGPVRKRRSSA